MSELLVDYLEDAAAFIKKRKERLNELEKYYRETYSKDIREEMEIIKKEIRKKRKEITDKLYENSEELNYIKKYFPDFFEVLLEEDEIGKIIKKEDLLYDRLRFPGARQHLLRLKAARAQLKDAIDFLEKWPGIIKEKQLIATYPILKGEIEGDKESGEIIEKIKELEKKLVHEGWKVIISNEDILLEFLDKYIKKLNKAEINLKKAQLNYEDAKGKGTVTENNALRMLRAAEKNKKNIEEHIRKMLLANPLVLAKLKKKKWLARDKKTQLEKIAEKITPKKIKEKVWLTEMKKRLG
ncbi:MAG: hypothetical protein QW153_03225 [Candidatus Bilamarchaeaceae archaeon]